jgi:hypothetical protein
MLTAGLAPGEWTRTGAAMWRGVPLVVAVATLTVGSDPNFVKVWAAVSSGR